MTQHSRFSLESVRARVRSFPFPSPLPFPKGLVHRRNRERGRERERERNEDAAVSSTESVPFQAMRTPASHVLGSRDFPSVPGASFRYAAAYSS